MQTEDCSMGTGEPEDSVMWTLPTLCQTPGVPSQALSASITCTETHLWRCPSSYRSTCNVADLVRSLCQGDPFNKEMATHILLPGESHGQRRLAGYSPWGHRESDMTEQLTLFHFQATGVITEGIRKPSPSTLSPQVGTLGNNLR